MWHLCGAPSFPTGQPSFTPSPHVLSMSKECRELSRLNYQQLSGEQGVQAAQVERVHYKATQGWLHSTNCLGS